MKKMLGVAAVSLWAAALLFTPAPADAWLGIYPSASRYFACSGWTSVYGSCVFGPPGEEDTIYWTGKMTNTIPLSACAGSCSGTENLLCEANPGNGRKTAGTTPYGQCAGKYILEFATCNNCS